MANITAGNASSPNSGDFFSKMLHSVKTLFSRDAKRAPRNLSSLNDSTLADIGMRRDQVMTSTNRLNESDQRLYWI